jgi:AcrR family transcriptional regulator
MGSAVSLDAVSLVPAKPTRRTRTRARLLEAARTVFERDGFIDARISDIAKAAHVAHGTFYTHFDTKIEIFRAVVQIVLEELTPSEGPELDSAEPSVLIEQANRRYFAVFSANAGIFAAIDQVGTFDDQGRELRRQLRHGYEQVAVERIRHWQDRGLVDTTLDVEISAIAVTALVGRFTQVCLSLEPGVPQERALAHLNLMYGRALGISNTASHPDRPTRRRRRQS